MESRSFVPRDTDPEAYDIQTLSYRRMGGIGRTAVMFRLTEMARKNAASGIRERHPDYDEEQFRLALFRLRFGDELARQVFPGRALPDP
jgi:hypothetical protein